MEGAFFCPLCSELSATPTLLRIHMLSQHRIELPAIRRLQDVEGLLMFLHSLIFPSILETVEVQEKEGLPSCTSEGVLPSPVNTGLAVEDKKSAHDQCDMKKVNPPHKTTIQCCEKKEEPKVAPTSSSIALSTPRLFHCPVCRAAVGISCTSVEKHCSLVQHHRWNWRTVEKMGMFYKKNANGEIETDEDWDERDPVQEGKEPLSDEEGGQWEEEEPIRCLYCPYEGTDCLGHMFQVHQMDLKSFTSQRPDEIKDEYDLIRLVNMVRRAVRSGACPFHITGKQQKISTQNKEETRWEGEEENEWTKEACAREVEEKGLEAHLLAHPTHRVPQCIERGSGDEWLVPLLPEDTLISHLITFGEGFLAEETPDPDFPLVPTILQLAERRRQDEEMKRR